MPIRMTCVCGLGDEQSIGAKLPSLSHMESWGQTVSPHMPPSLAVMRRVCVRTLAVVISIVIHGGRSGAELRVTSFFSLVPLCGSPLLCFYFSALIPILFLSSF